MVAMCRCVDVGIDLKVSLPRNMVGITTMAKLLFEIENRNSFELDRVAWLVRRIESGRRQLGMKRILAIATAKSKQ